MLSREEFRLLQMQYLRMAEDFHKFCTENCISYFLMGGSALGYLRHGGFIPWDIDIDVGLLRPEYDRLQRICLEKGFGSGYRYACYMNDENHQIPHALLYLENSEVVFADSDRRVPLFLDLFPYDSVPSSLVTSLIQLQLIGLYKQLIMGKRNIKRTKNSPSRRLIKNSVQMLLTPLSWRSLHRWGDGVMRLCSDSESVRVTNMAGRYSYDTESVLRRSIGTPKLGKFEGVELFMPENAQSFVRSVYGDYMTLPSEEEQEAYWNSIESFSLPDGREYGVHSK